MAEGGDGTRLERVAIFAITAFFTAFGFGGRFRFIPAAKAVIERIRFIGYVGFAAMADVGRVALFRTGGRRYDGSVGMPRGFGQNRSANRADLRFRAGCIFAGLVTERRDALLRNNGFAATGAFLSFGKPCLCTSRRNCLQNNGLPVVMAVTERGDGACFKCIAILTIAAFFTHFGLRGRFRFIPITKAVTRCMGIRIDVGMSAMAGVCGIARFGTGRLRDGGDVTVTEGGNDFLRLGYLAASRTLFTLGKSRFRTGRRHRLQNDGIPIVMAVTERGEGACLECIAILTITALFTAFGFGGGFRFDPLAEAVTERACVGVDVGMSAMAGVRGMTRFGTGRICNVGGIAVTENGNDLLRLGDLTAACAFLALGQTCFCTGRSDRLQNDGFPTVMAVRERAEKTCFKRIAILTIAALLAVFGFGRLFDRYPFAEAVTECGDGPLRFGDLAAAGAFLALGQTRRRTGGRDCIQRDWIPTVMAVGERGDGARFISLAVSAVPALFAVFGFGGGFRFGPLTEAVTRGTDICIRIGMTATGAGVRCISLLGTGRLRYRDLVAVSACLDQNCLTNRANLGLGTGCR